MVEGRVVVSRAGPDDKGKRANLSRDELLVRSVAERVAVAGTRRKKKKEMWEGTEKKNATGSKMKEGR